MIRKLRFLDQKPETADFRQDVVAGLRSSPKRIPPKFFYNAEGSALFERITQLEEYYLTRTELSIIEENRMKLARTVGENATLVEFGGGNLSKARLFLDLPVRISNYVAVDISSNFLHSSAEKLSSDYPDLNVTAICADFMKGFEIPEIEAREKTTGLFLGSSIGNFERDRATMFVRECSQFLSSGDKMIIGVDNRKEKWIIESAYNDVEGVTAEFNSNLLKRINDELGGDFSLADFKHNAFYDEIAGRIEMHLVSMRDCDYSIGSEYFHFRKGESIHTENSYKYSEEEFRSIASGGNFSVSDILQDSRKYYSLYILERN